MVISQLDITAPKYTVVIEYDQKRNVLYVHVDGYTALRICRMITPPILEIGEKKLVVMAETFEGNDG